MASSSVIQQKSNNEPLDAFSDDLRHQSISDMLSRGLASKVIIDRHREKELGELRDQWNTFLLEGREIAISSIPDEEVFLLDQSRQLYRAWAKFCEQLPGEERELLKGRPDLKLLYKSVDVASSTWEKNRAGTQSGRLKETFTGLCECFKSHSNLVSILPKNDKYVTLLTGSLSAIAQATINHQEIASGVAATMEQLSQDMFYWNSLLTEYGNIELMQRYIMELYVVVFEFLTEIFCQWSKSSWKRFLKSFDETAFQKLFNDRRARIQVIEKRMRRIADLKFQQGTREKQGQMRSDLDIIIQNQLNQKQMILKLGEDIYSLLNHQPVKTLPSKPSNLSLYPVLAVSKDSADTTGVTREIMTTINDPHIKSVESTDDETQLQESQWVPNSNYDRQLILSLLDPIVKSFKESTQAIVNITSRALRVTIDNQVKRHIDTWITNPHSEAIWILGPHEVSNPSQNTLTAVCLIALSRRHDVPCLSYFCSSTETHASSGSVSYLSHKELLLDMVKSFILQLLLLSPAEHTATDSDLDLSPSRFSRLIERDIDIEEALELFLDVRHALAPRYLHCVVEAAHILEDRRDSQHTRQLQRVFREIVRPPPAVPIRRSSRNSNLGDPDRDLGNEEVEKKKTGLHLPKAQGTGELESESESGLEKIMKVCFTSDGYMDALAELTRRNGVKKVEYVDEAGQYGEEEGSRLLDNEL